MTRSTDSGLVLAPETVEVLQGLQPVSVGHRGTEEGFNGGLEGADLDDLHLHAEFLHRAGVVHLLGSQTFPIHPTGRVQTDSVCHGRNVVVGLTVTLGGRDDPFAAGLEIEQGVTDRFRTCRCHGQLRTIEPDTDDLIVVLRQTNVTQNIIQSDIVLGCVVTVRHLTHERRERIVLLRLLDEVALHLKPIDGLVLQIHRRGGEHVTHQPAQQGATNEIHGEENETSA